MDGLSVMAMRRGGALQNLILISKRASAFYLEKSTVKVKDGSLVYSQTITNDKTSTKTTYFYNLPYANMSCLFLGMGTSITNSAVRLLASQNVMFGFVGGSGSPQAISDPVFLPSAGYRPSPYMQQWYGIWNEECLSLAAARMLMTERVKTTVSFWRNHSFLKSKSISYSPEEEMSMIAAIACAGDRPALMGIEGSWTRDAYRRLAGSLDGSSFKRIRRLKSGVSDEEVRPADEANARLDMGNHMAYGMAAAAIHALGISFSLPLLHGNTRRGGLVFDIADLFKDALVLPAAFASVVEQKSTNEFRKELLATMSRHRVIDLCIDTMKTILDANAGDQLIKQGAP